MDEYGLADKIYELRKKENLTEPLLSFFFCLLYLPVFCIVVLVPEYP